eukprot:3877427-Amphidinium_carterae.2
MCATILEISSDDSPMCSNSTLATGWSGLLSPSIAILNCPCRHRVVLSSVWWCLPVNLLLSGGDGYIDAAIRLVFEQHQQPEEVTVQHIADLSPKNQSSKILFMEAKDEALHEEPSTTNSAPSVSVCARVCACVCVRVCACVCACACACVRALALACVRALACGLFCGHGECL